jgi:O-Antigen ligase
MTTTVVPSRAPSAVHRLSLMAVWLTMALSAVVLVEPAPVDAGLIGLIILLPAVGLAQFDRVTGLYLAAWLLICAGGYISCIFAIDEPLATKHNNLTLYLSLSSAVLAAFIRTDPARHLRVIENGMMVAGLIAASTALIGIFHLVPGWEVFVRFDRATGTFKDPNVLGAFLAVPAMIALNRVASRQSAASVPGRLWYLIVLLITGLALLLSLSRGAVINLGVAVMVYFYLRFIAARATAERLHLVLFVAAGVTAALFIGVAALSFGPIGDLMASRLGAQSYDTGEQGRFAGQRIAMDVISANPLGIGPINFSPQYHIEAPHEVYLSMFLNCGWLGGFVWLLLCAATLFFGCRHALRPTPVQDQLFLYVGCWAGLVVEGFIIDSDHWRHLFFVLAAIWGIVASGQYQRPVFHGART